MKKILGFFFLTLPFTLLFAAIAKKDGLECALSIFGAVGILCGFILACIFAATKCFED